MRVEGQEGYICGVFELSAEGREFVLAKKSGAREM